MKLSEIETGSRVFVDANIFIYHFTGVSNECSDFLERCERGKIHATTTVSVIMEVLHCLMIVEATRCGRKTAKITADRKTSERIFHQYRENSGHGHCHKARSV